MIGRPAVFTLVLMGSGCLMMGCAGASIGIGAGSYGRSGGVGIGVNQPLSPPVETVYQGKVTIVEKPTSGKTVLHFEEGVSYQVEGSPNVRPGDTVKIKKTKTGFAVAER